MADWKEIRASVGRAANKAVRKTGEFADMASMRIKLKALELKRNEQYELLGKYTYRQLKSGESQAEKIAPVVERLDELRAKIQALVTDIENAKKENEEKETFKEEACDAEKENAEEPK